MKKDSSRVNETRAKGVPQVESDFVSYKLWRKNDYYSHIILFDLF